MDFRIRHNVPPEFLLYYFVIPAWEVSGVTPEMSRSFNDWINVAYFENSSVACRLYDLWVMRRIKPMMWMAMTFESMKRFARREARELLR